MIDEEFIRFAGRIFPSVSSQDQQLAIDAARKDPPTAGDLFAVTLPQKICQGDIVSELTFLSLSEDGRVSKARLPAMLLSHSCDFDNASHSVTFAPVFPFAAFAANAGLAGYLRKNQVFDRLFLPSVSGLGDRVVDFSRAQPFPVALIKNRCNNDPRFRQTSFTQVGYYFFVAKLAIHFLRPQAADELRGANGLTVSRVDRWRLAVGELANARRLLFGLVRAG